jgi:hypothetical protein
MLLHSYVRTMNARVAPLHAARTAQRAVPATFGLRSQFQPEEAIEAGL